jgi:NADPH:quinone reductase-like Zn-dependent oxidoreductase
MTAMEKSMMKAFVVDTPGDVDALKIKEIPIPSTKPGWVLVRIKAFGLNRTETFIRKGAVPNVDSYPLVPGIECVGIIEDPSDSNFTKEWHLNKLPNR